MQPQPEDERADSRRTVARASIIMFAAITLGRLLGFARDATISHLFGQSGTTDLFNMAFVVPDLLYFLLAGGALTAAFIPVFTDYLTQGNHPDAWRVFSTIGTFLTLVVGALVLLGEVFAVPLVRLLLSDPKFTPADVAECARLMRIVLPAQVCFLLGGLMMGALQSQQRFLVPALGPLIYNAAIIAGGVFLAPALGIAGFSWGALAGAVAGNVLLQYAVLRRMGLAYRPALHLRHPGVRRVAGMMGAVTLSLALPQILVELNRVFARGLAEGVISALVNTNRLMQAPLAMFGQALAVALLPTLAVHASRRDTAEFRETLNRALRAILFATVPVSALMIALSEPLVRLVFEHGRFTASDTAVAAPILAVYATAVAAWSVQAVVARACFALGDNRTPVLAGLAVFGIFVLLNLAFVAPFGGPGLAAATSLSGLAIALAMTEVLRRHLGGIGGRELVVSVGKLLLASVPMALAAWAAAGAAGSAPGIGGGALPPVAVGFLQCVVGSAAGGVVFVGMALLLRLPEAGAAWARLRKRVVERH
ncbi:MAG: murein biosynthesis integral membrane protein MurJ [Armatimonadetes bacterium]|nr:murein biosynthesis integral membrane protein MurJ [Armatimonadota bacterium]